MITFVKKNIKLSLVLLLLTGIVYYFFTRDIIVETKDRTNHHYVNNLYLSNDYIYNQLSPDEQESYDLMFNTLKKSKSKLKTSASDFGCDLDDSCSSLLQELFDAIAVDQPGLINFATFSWMISGDDLTIKFTNATPLKFASEIGMIRIERILDDIKRKTSNMTDAQKILYVYEWIGDHSKYDTTFTFASKNQSVYNVFIKHNAVCAGFSKTSSVIFQNIGIEAYSVTGKMDPSNKVGHMWNIVNVDGKYYYFDSTWAASRRNKNEEDYYNGLLQIEMNDYTLDHPEWYPDISYEAIPNILN